MASHANFVSRERAVVVALLDALEGLRALKRQWDTLGYSGVIVAGDLTGANADLQPADVGNFVLSADAIDQFCATNFHFANLEKARS